MPMQPKPVKPPPGDAGKNAKTGQQARQDDDRVASPLRILSDVFEGITGSVASALLGPVVAEPSLSAKASAPSDPGGPLASVGSPRKEPRPTHSTSITGTRARPSKPLPNTRGAVDTQHPATLPPAADMLQGMTLSRLPQPPSNKRLSHLAEQGPQYPVVYRDSPKASRPRNSRRSSLYRPVDIETSVLESVLEEAPVVAVLNLSDLQADRARPSLCFPTQAQPFEIEDLQCNTRRSSLFKGRASLAGSVLGGLDVSLLHQGNDDSDPPPTPSGGGMPASVYDTSAYLDNSYLVRTCPRPGPSRKRASEASPVGLDDLTDASAVFGEISQTALTAVASGDSSVISSVTSLPVHDCSVYSTPGDLIEKGEFDFPCVFTGLSDCEGKILYAGFGFSSSKDRLSARLSPSALEFRLLDRDHVPNLQVNLPHTHDDCVDDEENGPYINDHDNQDYGVLSEETSSIAACQINVKQVTSDPLRDITNSPGAAMPKRLDSKFAAAAPPGPQVLSVKSATSSKVGGGQGRLIPRLPIAKLAAFESGHHPSGIKARGVGDRWLAAVAQEEGDGMPKPTVAERGGFGPGANTPRSLRLRSLMKQDECTGHKRVEIVTDDGLTNKVRAELKKEGNRSAADQSYTDRYASRPKAANGFSFKELMSYFKTLPAETAEPDAGSVSFLQPSSCSNATNALLPQSHVYSSSRASRSVAEGQCNSGKMRHQRLSPSRSIEESEAIESQGASTRCEARVALISAQERKVEKQALNRILDLHFDRKGNRRRSSLEALEKQVGAGGGGWELVPSLLV